MEIKPKEWRWVSWFAVIIILVTAIPYGLGFFSQGSEWRFTGFVFGVEDGNSYIAKMLRGAAGDWLFHTPYTAYPQQGVIAFLPYTVLGKLAYPPGQHEQLIVLFQLFRIVGAAAYIFATYWFCALFLASLSQRRIATILITAGGGLGWLSILGLDQLWPGRSPLEFYSPETFGFLGIYGLPHLAVGRALLFLGLGRYLSPPTNRGIKSLGATGLIWFGLGLMQPLTVVIGWGLIGFHFVLTWLYERWQKKASILILPKLSWEMAIIYLAPAPLVLYTVLSFTLDPFLRGWTAQNLILSPPIGDYLLAFGTVLPLTILGCVLVIRCRNRLGFFLVSWLVLFPFLAYFPYNLQRRLPEGVWAAWVILAMIALQRVPGIWRKACYGIAFSGVLCSLFLILGGVGIVVHPAQPVFRPLAEVEMFQYLSQNSNFNDVVLASFETSNALPAWAAVRTVIGHGPESINARDLVPRVSSFYSGKAGVDLVDEFKVRYIIYGPAEKRLGGGGPESLARYSLVFDRGGYQVFQVAGN